MAILFVCTGNLCRSPLGAQLLGTWAASDLGPDAAGMQIASAGVEAPEGQPMDADSTRALIEVGGDPAALGAHRSRALTAAELEDVDLVLTMTRWHRRKVLGLAPRALRRTFTLPEASVLLELTDAGTLAGIPLDERARTLAAALNAARARRRVSDRDDVPDPVGRPLDVHRLVAARIATELRPVADVLFDVSSARSRSRSA